MFRKYFKGLVCRKYGKNGFAGYVYDFSVDYTPIAVDDIKDIHKYLMEKRYYTMNKESVINGSIYDYVYRTKIINHNIKLEQ